MAAGKERDPVSGKARTTVERTSDRELVVTRTDTRQLTYSPSLGHSGGHVTVSRFTALLSSVLTTVTPLRIAAVSRFTTLARAIRA